MSVARSFRRAMVVLAGGLFVLGLAEAGTIYVDDNAPNDPWPGNPLISDPLEDGSAEHPFDAIQKAINLAAGGDEVVLADGTYTGNGNRDLDFGGKAITVRSASGDPARCVIDCQGSRGFYFHSVEGPDSAAAGLSIIHGDSGVSCNSASSPTLTNCTISGNTASPGSGVYCNHSNPTLTNCTISGNSYSGVSCSSYSSPTLTNCTISGNSSAGVSCGSYCCPTLTNCTISGNSSAGVSCGSYSCPTLTNCTIRGNSSDGVSCGSYSSLTLIHCTISGNSRCGVDCSSSSPTLANCIVWGNAQHAIYASSGSNPVVTYCDVQGGWAGVGNINSDPQLTPDGHLIAGSLAINAGDPNRSYVGQQDIDGEPRLGGGRVDMGSDEWFDADGDGLPDWWEQRYFDSPTAGDPNADPDGDGHDNLADYAAGGNPWIGPRTYYVALGGNDVWDGLTPAWDGEHGPKATIQAGIDACATHELDSVVIADGTYTGVGNRDLDLRGKAITVRGVHRAIQCVIDCQGSRGFYFHGGEGPASVVAGLSIIHGKWCVFCDSASSPTLTDCTISGNSHVSYGVYCTFSSPTLTHCTISGNSYGVYCTFSSPTLTNCIVWGNAQHAIYASSGSNPVVTYCDVQGGWAGVGNIDADPQVTPDKHLTAGSPAIDAGDPHGSHVGQQDIDGEPRLGGGRVDMGSDEWFDADGDGLPDWWEQRYFGSPTAGDPNADPDGDGLVNLAEYETYGSNPIAPPYRVDAGVGDDAYDGLAPAPQGGNVGPKKTIQAALGITQTGDTVLVAAGTYTGVGNFNLHFGNKAVVLRARDGADSTTIDCGGAGRAVDLSSTTDGPVIIEGFTVAGGKAAFGAGLRTDSPLMMRNLVLGANVATAAGGSLYSLGACLAVDNVTIGSNTAPQGDGGVLYRCNVSLRGPLDVLAGTVQAYWTWFDGSGSIDLARAATLQIKGGLAGDPPSVIRSNVTGTGTIVIDAGQQLLLTHSAVVDLSGDTGGGCADLESAADWGRIEVNGQLVVRDATVRNTNVDVLAGDLADRTIIHNNQINLLQNPPGWGGKFFVEGTSTIECNVIYSEGDRYLDFDPDPNAGPRPTIGSLATGNPNRFYVTIKQGVGLEQGELLELRAVDYDNAVGSGHSGAYQVWASPGYADTWAFERLEVQAGAKVNLVNRPGFVFQDPNIAIPEALYVKELELHRGAVFNTGMQRLYFQRLVGKNGQPLVRDVENPSAPMANGSRIVDYPLLGFSLKIIAMEDATEFEVRVALRSTDPNDNNPPPPQPAIYIGQIARVAAPLAADPNNTAMQMLAHAPGKQSASSVAAHGAFARAGEDQIVIEFKYRFCGASDPNTAIVVYLSDSPEVGTPASADPNHYVEVARVYPPQTGRPGSIGSSDFATFHGIFPRGNLNFTRGTYVELELRGQDACIEIDDWDPQIKCTTTCHDLSGDYGVSNRDYLLLLAEYGQPVPTHKGCLDSKLSEDLYVDIGDVLAWDALLSTYPPPLNLCDAEPYSGGTGSAVTPPTSGLLIAGKPNAAGVEDDRLYPFNPAGQAAGTALLPASAAEGGHYRGNGRLMRDPNGHLYQLHATQGLIRLDTAARAIIPGSQSFGGSTVDVGVTPTGSDVYPNAIPLLDVAFSKGNPNVAYMSPVLVEPPDGPEYAYKAAARLELSSGTYSVTKLYGMDPRSDGCTNTVPPGVSECTLQGLREVEVDGQGNVFVLSASAQSPNNDWLVVYDESSGTERLRLLLTSLNPALRSPTALLVSQFDPNYLYLASAVDADPNTPQTHVYRCTIQRSGGAVTDITLPSGQDIVINNPVSEPNNPLGYLATVTSLSESTSDGRLYVVGFTMAKVPEELSTNDPLYQQLFSDGSILETLPTLAQIPAGSSGPITATILTGHDLALPLSAVFLGTGPAICRGDTNCDGLISYGDINPFVVALNNPSTWQTQHPGCPWQNCDVNGDGVVSYGDINPFIAKLSSPGPCP